MSISKDRPLGQHREGNGVEGGTGGLGSSPIVANLTASPDGEGLSRKELEEKRLYLSSSTERQGSIKKERSPIYQFRQSFPLDPSLNVPPPSDLPVYSSTLLPEQSFHSTLLTTFSIPTTQSDADATESALGCTVLLIYHIPPSIILDPFQINQLFADGALGDSVRFFGDVELELPLSRLSDRAREGSGLILEINPFKQNEKPLGKNGERIIELGVPLHGRYLEPKTVEERSERTVDIEWPWVGLTCPLSSPLSFSLPSLPSSEVPRLPSPFPPDLFSSLNQTFYSFRPDSATSSSRIDGPLTVPMILPVGDPSHLPFVEISTAIAVWLGAIWVGWCMLCRIRSGRDGEIKAKTE